MFLTKEPNDAGCYAIRFYLNGEEKVVVVDDYFPWFKQDKNFAFSRSTTDHEIWVLLLEKAWAKIFGSYQAIESGIAGEALPALTGAPAKVLWHMETKNKDELWKTLLDADRKNFVLSTTI
jgi:calpain-15